MSEETRILSLSDLNSKLDALFEKVEHLTVGSGKTEDKKEPADVSGQVEAALANVKAKDEAASKEAATEARFKKLEELTEKKPVSYKRLTRLIWGNE